MDREELENIVRLAFEKGEQQGVTYSTWFTPSEEDTEQKIQDAIFEILQEVQKDENSNI